MGKGQNEKIVHLDFKSYPAKILLFGEYAVLLGHSALGIPYTKYSGKLSTEEHCKGNISEYLNFLQELALPFLKSENLNFLLNNKVGYDSDIPIGYGMGSSAALTAAIYDYCKKEKIDTHPLSDLQDRLATMENFFHGKSSGFDPLVTLLNTPILKSTEKVESINLPLDTLNLNIYLFDSNLKRNTKGFVSSFMAHSDNAIYDQFYSSSNTAIQNLLHKESILDEVKSISQFQYSWMRKMIPDEVLNVWQKGLDRGEYYMKLCGAGGGGCFLLFSNRDLAKSMPELDLLPIKLKA